MNTILDFNGLMDCLRSMPERRKVAIACPNDSHTEYVIERALNDGIADFLLVTDGHNRPELDSIIERFKGHAEKIVTSSPDDAARKAVSLVRQKHADVLMKGTINTDNLLRAVLDKECGLLEPGHVLSHITVTKIPSYDKLLLFSDAAVIPRPTLEQFESIVSYGIEICRRLGKDTPRVALIHCTEKVNEKFPHTLSYESLKRKAAEGCFGDVFIDGPMDVKTACDKESGIIKGIDSPVVGNADMLVFPNIESGNVFYKTITLFAGAEMAGMLCGTTAPVVVASRADSNESKYYSLALACLGYNS